MNAYSYSRLKLYDNCPAAYYYKYILELPDPPGEPLIIGKVVHLAVEKYLTQQRQQVKADINDCVNEAIKETGTPGIKEEVQNICRNPAIDNSVFRYGHAQIEHGFYIPLDNEGKYAVQGAIDYFEQGLPEKSAYLVDWKTNHVRYGADNLQMGLYAWYLSQKYGVDKVYANMIFLRYHQASCVEQSVFTAAGMEKARSWALGLIKEIEAGLVAVRVFGGDPAELFPAMPCANCQSCNYVFQCAKGMNLLPVKVEDKRQAIIIAGDILRLEGALSAMKEELKAWVKSTGQPVAIPGGEFCFTPTTAWNFSAEGMKALCKKLDDQGIKLWEHITIGAASLKKLALSESELLKYGEKKNGEAFRFIKSHEIKNIGSLEEKDNSKQKPKKGRKAVEAVA